MAHVSQAKKDTVKQFTKLVEQYPIVGIVNMEGLPTYTVQDMRTALRKRDVELHMTKKRLIKLILENAESKKPGINKMSDSLKGMPALIFARINPFKLFKQLEKSKSSAPAKGGQEAPKDIIVPAGPTGFAPGPIIGELGSFKIKAGIDAGKVVIKEDSQVAKEGDIISKELAAVLTRLGIKPMEIGLDLRAVYEDGSIFDKNILAIDEQEYIDKITLGHQSAFNLAVQTAMLTSDTTDVIIGKAFNDAKGLAISQAIYSKDVIDQIIAKAQAGAMSIENMTKEA